MEIKRSNLIETNLALTSQVRLAKALIKRGVNTSLAVQVVKGVKERNLINNRFTIKLFSNPAEFNPQNVYTVSQHSWAGRTEDWETVTPLLSDLEIGEYIKKEYSANGKPWETTEESECDSDYTIADPQACVIKREGIDTMNNSHNDYSEWVLAIYVPNLDTLKQERKSLLEALKLLGF